jgi:hypothetical protein
VVALHVAWNDAGYFGLEIGRVLDPIPESGEVFLEGTTWSNCETAPGVGCRFTYSQTSSVLFPGDDGFLDIIVSQEIEIFPQSFIDPEYPNQILNPIFVGLTAHSIFNDSEVLAYSTATLQQIIVPAGVNLTFASGHAYPITVVPEPGTLAMFAMGIAGLTWLQRRRARPAASSGEAVSRFLQR